MPAHLSTMCRAAWSCPTPTAPYRVPRAASASQSDQPYVPQQPAEDGGLIDLLASTQVILMILAGVIALTLLVFQLWSDRRKAGDEEQETAPSRRRRPR